MGTAIGKRHDWGREFPFPSDTTSAFRSVMGKVRESYRFYLSPEGASLGAKFMEIQGHRPDPGPSSKDERVPVCRPLAGVEGVDPASFLLMAADYMDIETSSHVRRISRYSEVIAGRAGLSKGESSLLGGASPFHDIGKLWIPDSILQKPGRLTGEERSVMENHTIYGAEIMAHIDSQVFSLGSLIALTHHEWWDGTGYPSGLKGEEIPIPGRVVALADVFDALTTARLYKKAWSAASAFREIRGDSGIQFDPRLVDCLMDAADEIMDCKEAG